MEMADHQVTCIHLSHGAGPGEITHFGGANWLLTRAEVLASLAKGERFFTLDPRTFRQVWVHSRNEPGHEPLQAKVDGLWSESLKLLPECKEEAHKRLRPT